MNETRLKRGTAERKPNHAVRSSDPILNGQNQALVGQVFYFANRVRGRSPPPHVSGSKLMPNRRRLGKTLEIALWLLAATQREGVRTCGGARVELIRHDQDGKTLHTARGNVRAKEVIIATNAYTGGETAWIRRRLVRSSAFMAATEPLEPTLLTKLMPTQRTYVDRIGKRRIYARIAGRRLPPPWVGGEVVTIGDCFSPRTAEEAVLDGLKVGSRL